MQTAAPGAAEARHLKGNRSGVSPKLLRRKLLEGGPAQLSAQPDVEASFPGHSAAEDRERKLAETPVAQHSGSEPGAAPTDQRLRATGMKPNPGTVLAALVQLVEERVDVSRTQLIALIRSGCFSHPKSRAGEKGWCEGYVAGAIRGGYLAVAVGHEAPSAHPAS